MEPFNVSKHTFQSGSIRELLLEAADYFDSSPVYELPPSKAMRFKGGGVYAIYYKGAFSYYAPLATRNAQGFLTPLYVGKAVAPGARMGLVEHDGNHTSLYSRLRQHAGSIQKAHDYGVKNGVEDTIKLSDFYCRFMVIPEEFAGLTGPVESAIIRRHKPLWNAGLDGFGNHTPGKRRFDQSKSPWDVLHPGREWADKCRGPVPEKTGILSFIESHLAKTISS
ncbi:Eco29kI family restriction endonuclease [Hymenobacter sp. ASUV-10]|uniref:Eco29kI family restriction endonuclease n=1 Tax=Hymenobacter aranciens TaxID=3063996 RepID=A0ABT9BCN0_9BACT|nr:Eco29kI family restriction endonuclease [Hymenobacter sp. ASUV-10]MDO7874303.1 Eco29kI family restriction endonuclease [Hymenobacter sp. ASUV-10]